MDRTSDVVYVPERQFNEPMRCLARIAKLKSLRLIPVPMDNAKCATIVYRGVQVFGFWPSVEYLLDVRPYPNLLPSTVRERAIVRTSADLVLSQPMHIGQFHTLYVRANGDTEIPGTSPSLLDVAIASFKETPIAETFPWVDRLASRVDAITDRFFEDLPVEELKIA